MYALLALAWLALAVCCMERSAKLARLNEFRRNKPSCSASALEAILKDVRKNGVPDLWDRDDMREARDELIAHTQTPFGPILDSITCFDTEGNAVKIPIGNPFAWLYTCAKDATEDGFGSFFKQRLLESPPSPEKPWRIILYSDEVTPGNVLAVLNLRKFQAIYWSFMELGVNALSHEEAWFVLLTEFSSCINKLSAGISQVFAECIKTFFQQDGFNMAGAGINLEFPDQCVRLWAELGAILQDGGAHKFVWCARGDGASKFCLLCNNLFTHKSAVTDDDGTNLLRCNVIELSGLHPAAGNELRVNARFLAGRSAHMATEDFASLQQAIGLTYHPHNILLHQELDDILDPTQVYMHDYMHGLYVDGVANMTLYLLLEAFWSFGHKNIYQTLSEFVSKFKWPARAKGDHLGEIFAEPRGEKHRKAQHIKCQASDMLSLIGVLASFAQTVLLVVGRCNESCMKACAAFLALVDVCELIAATHRMDVSPARLLGSIHRFLELFVASWGFEWLTPKCHWMLHYAESLARNGKLFNCFVLERKHRVPKRYAEDIKNISRNASTSILSEVLCHNLASLKRPVFDFSIGLVGGRPASKATRKLIWRVLELEDRNDVVMISNVSRISALESCQRYDVVLLRDGHDSIRAGKVALHFAAGGLQLSLVHLWTLHHKVDGTAMAIWTPTNDQAECWKTSDILVAVEHIVYPDGTVGTILPMEWR